MIEVVSALINCGNMLTPSIIWEHSVYCCGTLICSCSFLTSCFVLILCFSSLWDHTVNPVFSSHP